jgi:hypothetical protein
MIRRTFSLTGLVLLAALATPAAPVSGPLQSSLQAQDNPTFAGSWTLDPEESENPRDVMQQSRRGTGSNFAERGNRRHGSEGGRGGGGGRGGRGGGGAAPSAEQQQINRVMMEIGMWQAPSLEIEMTDEGYEVTLPDGSVQTILTDKEERTTARGGFEIKTKAEGKDGEFKISYKGPGNAKVERKFKLKDDGATLEVVTSIDNSRMQMNFKFEQVYRRSD